MKNLVILLLSGYLFSQASIDTTKKPPIFDLSKGLNIPGLIPDNIPSAEKLQLLPYKIEEIKEKARNYDPEPISTDDVVMMETNRGTMKLKFFPDVAPKHCKNFKKLANSGYYDGTTFHRIIPGFMIQGGDINSRDNDPKNDGLGGPGWTVDAEFNKIPHKRGILSMARGPDPNSAGSQFFICVADAPHLDGSYTAFGEVIENVHVIDHIVKTPTDYDQVKRMSKKSIPNGEDPDHWITIRDPKTNGKLYSKIPQYMQKADYEYDMRNKIRSNRPALPLTIINVRVVKGTDVQDK